MESGNTKQIPPSKKWVFTCNNYTECIINQIVPKFKRFCECAFFSKEVGESGTPHLQGYMELKKKDRPLSKELFKELSTFHWEKAKGTRQQNLEYCTKSDPLAYSQGLPADVKVIGQEQFMEWQKRAYELYQQADGDDRSVYWIYGNTNVGKTAFLKHLIVKEDCILGGSGKYSDIINLIFNQDMTRDRSIVFNLPLANQGKVSYAALESIKDGLIANTKYEAGYKVFNSPRVFCFANFMPDDTSKLAADRWKIFKIKGELLVPHLEDIMVDSDDESDDEPFHDPRDI